jgi:hypothetical protein
MVLVIRQVGVELVTFAIRKFVFLMPFLRPNALMAIHSYCSPTRPLSPSAHTPPSLRLASLSALLRWRSIRCAQLESFVYFAFTYLVFTSLTSSQACEERINKAGTGDCEGWYFDYWHCIDKCVSLFCSIFLFIPYRASTHGSTSFHSAFLRS